MKTDLALRRTRAGATADAHGRNISASLPWLRWPLQGHIPAGPSFAGSSAQPSATCRWHIDRTDGNDSPTIASSQSRREHRLEHSLTRISPFFVGEGILKHLATSVQQFAEGQAERGQLSIGSLGGQARRVAGRLGLFV
ncbi:hypothetical protein VE00_02321 [Pseudogymnoascus sp. WSF 3629]|nr:hypothetical protein VE00_02321 [Pseudogymnoascus sp. WSF 3629]